MSWLRDVLKALAWAVAGASLSVSLALTGFFSGLVPHLVPLVIVLILALRYHDSRRIAILVVLWLLVLGVAAGLFLAWAFRDFKFRAIQG